MLNAKGINESEFLEYKGRPLVRKDNEIYYGDLSDKFHVFIMIMAPGAIMVQLMAKDSNRPERQYISKEGLADALETAAVWLESYNK